MLKAEKDWLSVALRPRPGSPTVPLIAHVCSADQPDRSAGTLDLLESQAQVRITVSVQRDAEECRSMHISWNEARRAK
jgi:hypothetical protein